MARGKMGEGAWFLRGIEEGDRDGGFWLGN